MILGTFIKQPADVLDYDIDFTDWLGSYTPKDTLATVVGEVDVDTLTILSATINGDKVKVWLAAGVAGTSYKITVTVETGDHRVIQHEFKVKVKET